MTTTDYIKHTLAGTGNSSWKVQWTAPSKAVAGPVTFYAAGNDANGDGSNQGDTIYTVTQTITEEGPTTEDPEPDIEANQQDGPVIVAQGDRLVVTCSLEAGDGAGNNSDWWVYAESPFGTYWFTLNNDWVKSNTPIRTYGGPLFDLAPYIVLDRSNLPKGNFNIHFSVDGNMDGVKDDTYTDDVQVTIQ